MSLVAEINIKTGKGTPKQSLEAAELTVDFGLKGDAHAGNPLRQVSLLARESIDKLKASGIEGFCTRKFVQNITTAGIELHSLSAGSLLKINDALLEITQIGKECYQDCPAGIQTKDCIMSKEVAFARVIKGGIIKIGAEIGICKD